ncbi:MAG TPA: NAD(+) synthase [Phycisphaerae bacterium]|nr:NAD(+) synthase [Phycisphaerae bacterium]
MNADALKTLKADMGIDPAAVSTCLEDFIRSHMEKLERKGAILGLSGGVDSAVVAALCARAVGADRTVALIMPERDSKRQHVDDALKLADQLRIEARLIDITCYLKKLGVYGLLVLNKIPLTMRLKGLLVRKAYRLYAGRAGRSPFAATMLGFSGKRFAGYIQKGAAYYRVKHRLRMVLLYLHAEIENKLVVGAANKTEYSIGYFVKHGCDDAADVMPLLKLYKTQVLELARHLGIPSSIVDKPPSPDIIPGMTDEEAIGMPYEQLDLILLALEKGWAASDITAALGVEERRIGYVCDLINRSAHMKRTYAP